MLDKRYWIGLITGLVLLWALLPALGAAQDPPPEQPAATGAGAAPEAVPVNAPAPVPKEYEVLDIPNDDGTNLGVVFKWFGAPAPGTTVTFELQVDEEQLEEYKLTESEQTRLDNALAKLTEDLAPLLPERDRLQVELDAAKTEYDLARGENAADSLAKCRAYYMKNWELEQVIAKIDRANDKFLKATSIKSKLKNLRTKAQIYEYLSGTLRVMQWLSSDVKDADPAGFDNKERFPEIFGHNMLEPDAFFVKLDTLEALNPDVIMGTFTGAKDATDVAPPPNVKVDLLKNHLYNVQMVVKTSPDDPGVRYELGGAKTKVDYFNVALLNNFIFAILFSIVILAAIMIARRNPNMFIRRIQGLEAVDEAIGRATEMGKPVLYLCGMDALAALNTLAAINVLGRVARRIADYDSELIVPCRDPVVLTVAQEVIKEAYIDQGRPDAFREDKIFFVTDDQFSYTATTCGIMMREKPAANFFMGGYYAESLLLAETGAATGAIQIAGSDSLNQLPFFITACDYTLIGEELYAASAYLSREPLLLGSLKGQDLGKALIMLLILVQTLLFAVQAIMGMSGMDVALDFLKILVQPL